MSHLRFLSVVEREYLVWRRGLGGGSVGFGKRLLTGVCYRYWWLLLGVAVLAMSGGGGEK